MNGVLTRIWDYRPMWAASCILIFARPPTTIYAIRLTFFTPLGPTLSRLCPSCLHATRHGINRFYGKTSNVQWMSVEAPSTGITSLGGAPSPPFRRTPSVPCLLPSEHPDAVLPIPLAGPRSPPSECRLASKGGRAVVLPGRCGASLRFRTGYPPSKDSSPKDADMVSASILLRKNHQ